MAKAKYSVAYATKRGGRQSGRGFTISTHRKKSAAVDAARKKSGQRWAAGRSLMVCVIDRATNHVEACFRKGRRA